MNRIGLIGDRESIDTYVSKLDGLVHIATKKPLPQHRLYRCHLDNIEHLENLSEAEWTFLSRRVQNEVQKAVFHEGCDYVALTLEALHCVAKGASQCVVSDSRSTLGWRPHPKYKTYHLPLVHFGDAIAIECHNIGARRVLYLSTELVMRKKFMRELLRRRHHIEVMGTWKYYSEEVLELDRIIREELDHGILTPEAMEFFLNFIRQYPSDGCHSLTPDAVVLGDYRLRELVSPGEIDIPMIDAREAHCRLLADLCLSSSN